MKKLLILIVATAGVSLIATFVVFRSEVQSPNSVLINDAVRISMESDSVREAVDIQMTMLMQAFEEMDTARRNRDNIVQIFVFSFILIMAVLGILVYLYYEKNLLRPFRKLETFASRIATGNLDIPLEMDEHNFFGAFTESFDLMREELRTARENEQLANQSKKELVASLSHDIKTPVASIQSAVDLMQLMADDEKEKKMLDSINVKCEQINTLITDMFHSTLEELQVLSVIPIEIPSTEVQDIIRQADYENRIAGFELPNCLVMADSLRLQQAFDNIINNSYKYANTDIYVSGFISCEYLVIAVQDFGSGVLDEELPLLTGKFYRGKQTGKTAGYGLGLYLSKYFAEQMLGDLHCENQDDGFVVKLQLRLAGNASSSELRA